MNLSIHKKYGITHARVTITLDASDNGGYNHGGIAFGYFCEGRFESRWTIEFQRHRLDVRDNAFLSPEPDYRCDLAIPWSGFYGGHPHGRRFSLDHPEDLILCGQFLARLRQLAQRQRINNTCDLTRLALTASEAGLIVGWEYWYRGSKYDYVHDIPDVERNPGHKFLEAARRAKVRQEVLDELAAEGTNG